MTISLRRPAHLPVLVCALAVAASTGAAALAAPAAPAGPGAAALRVVTPHLDPAPARVDVTRRPTVADLAAATSLSAGGRATGPATTGAALLRAAGTSVRLAGYPDGSPLVPTLAHHVVPSCTGTGTDGNRVQVLYAHEAGAADRYAAVLPYLRSYVGDVDDTFAVSAAETGGGRRVRWVQDADCATSVLDVALPAGALGSAFSATRSALQAAGYTSPHRKYLVFADAAQLCGIASTVLDSAPTANHNDGYVAQVARVDSACWDSGGSGGDRSVPAHELMHTLGAVQGDSPHHTAAGHCDDGDEVMCYVDDPTTTMTHPCPATHSFLFDCRGDDYFSLSASPTSYLMTHWNTASSSFLDPAPVLSAAPPVTVTGPTTVHAGLAAVLTAGAGGPVSTTAWSVQPAACGPADLTGTSLVLSCPPGYGAVTVQAAATVTAGDAPAVVVRRTVSFTTTDTLSAAVSARPDAATAAPGTASVQVAVTSSGAPVRAVVRLLDTRTGVTSAGVDTGAGGTVAVPVAPAVPTRYSVLVDPGPGWSPTAPAAVDVVGTGATTPSPAATPTPAPAQPAVVPTRAVLHGAVHGRRLVLRGAVTDLAGRPQPGLVVRLTATTARGTVVLATARTDVAGAVVLDRPVPAVTTTYRLRATADARRSAATSGPVAVRPAARVVRHATERPSAA